MYQFSVHKINYLRYIHKYINPDDAPLDKNIAIKHPYKTIGCLFNHKTFYANVQVEKLF